MNKDFLTNQLDSNIPGNESVKQLTVKLLPEELKGILHYERISKSLQYITSIKRVN